MSHSLNRCYTAADSFPTHTSPLHPVPRTLNDPETSQLLQGLISPNNEFPTQPSLANSRPGPHRCLRHSTAILCPAPLLPANTMSRTRDFTLREDSTLCIDCQGLCIDDKAAGGFMEVSEHGTPRLRFKKEKTMGLPAGALKLLTPQERTDTSPDFPKLANSAASGCGFCGFLRASLLMSKIQALQRQGEVSISLAYAWGLRSWGRSNEEGLQALVAQIRHAHNEEVATLHFSIFSSSGTYRHNCV